MPFLPSLTPLPSLENAYADRESMLLLFEEMEESWELKENRTFVGSHELRRAHYFLRYLQSRSFAVPSLFATGTGGVLFEWEMKTWKFLLSIEPGITDIIVQVQNINGYHEAHEFHDEQAGLMYISRLFNLL